MTCILRRFLNNNVHSFHSQGGNYLQHKARISFDQVLALHLWIRDASVDLAQTQIIFLAFSFEIAYMDSSAINSYRKNVLLTPQNIIPDLSKFLSVQILTNNKSLYKYMHIV